MCLSLICFFPFHSVAQGHKHTSKQGKKGAWQPTLPVATDSPGKYIVTLAIYKLNISKELMNFH